MYEAFIGTKVYWSFISFVDIVQIDIAVLFFVKREFHKTSWNDCYNFICSVFITIKQVKPDFFFVTENCLSVDIINDCITNTQMLDEWNSGHCTYSLQDKEH